MQTKQQEEGFTLIEIAIVVALIGFLMAILAPAILNAFRDNNVKATKIGISRVEQALEMYKLQNGRFPTTEQGLEALVRKPSSEPAPKNYPPGGYVKSDSLRDAWGTELRYEQPGTNNAHSYDVYSLGADDIEGGEGENQDLGNWETFEE